MVVEIMGTEWKSERIAVDFDKVSRVSAKFVDFLSRRTKTPIEAYLVLRWLCLNFEATYGFQLDPQVEDKLKTMITKEPEDNNS